MSKKFRVIGLAIVFILAISLSVIATAKKTEVKADDETFEMVNEALLRTDGDGLAFKVKMDAEVKGKIQSGKKLHFALVPESNIEELKKSVDEKTFDTVECSKTHAYYLDIPVDSKNIYEEDGYYYAKAGVSDVNENHRKMNYVAWAYYCDEEVGQEETTYSDYHFADFYKDDENPQGNYHKSMSSQYTEINAQILDVENPSKLIDIYDWFGGSDYPLEIEDNAKYAKLVEKVNNGKLALNTNIVINVSVDTKSAMLNESLTNAKTYCEITFEYADKTTVVKKVVKDEQIVAPVNTTATAEFTYSWKDYENTATATTSVTYEEQATKNKYTVTFKDYNGVEMQSGSVEYGTTPNAPAHSEALAGYTYGWEPTIVNVCGEATYTETKTANTDTAYTVKHYQQNLEDDGYTLKETEDKTGTTDTNTNAQAKTYTGFTAPQTITQLKIAGDGTTVVEIKYDRNLYTVTFKNGDDILQSSEVKYGATPSYDGTPVKTAEEGKTNVFVGWDKEVVSVVGEETYNAVFVEYTNVSDFTGFTAITKSSADGNYLLTADIDGKGASVGRWLDTFNGIIDGNGHTVKNISYGTNWDHSMIVTLSAGAVIKNIGFYNVWTTNNATASKSGFINDCYGTVENVSFVQKDETNAMTALIVNPQKGCVIKNVVAYVSNANASGFLQSLNGTNTSSWSNIYIVSNKFNDNSKKNANCFDLSYKTNEDFNKINFTEIFDCSDDNMWTMEEELGLPLIFTPEIPLHIGEKTNTVAIDSGITFGSYGTNVSLTNETKDGFDCLKITPTASDWQGAGIKFDNALTVNKKYIKITVLTQKAPTVYLDVSNQSFDLWSGTSKFALSTSDFNGWRDIYIDVSSFATIDRIGFMFQGLSDACMYIKDVVLSDGDGLKSSTAVFSNATWSSTTVVRQKAENGYEIVSNKTSWAGAAIVLDQPMIKPNGMNYLKMEVYLTDCNKSGAYFACGNSTQTDAWPSATRKQVTTSKTWTTVYIDVSGISEVHWVSLLMEAIKDTSSVRIRNIQFSATNS